MAIGQLRLKDPGRARTQENPNAPPSPSAYGLRHRIGKPVLSERQLSKAVVPAVESTQGVREALIVNAADFASPRINFSAFKRAGCEPSTLGQQGIQGREPSLSDAARRREFLQ
jgi:hypothetical protein